MKLELKHLAPYLPYGLRFLTNKHKIKYGEKTVLKSRGISLDDNGNVNIEFIYKDDLIFSNEMKSCKPILRPLSDLTKSITHNGKTFIPLAEILIAIPEASFRFIKSEKDVVIRIWEDKDGGEAMKFYLPPILGLNEHQHIQKLIEWHFDVYELIQKEIAINYNTLNK